MMISNPLGSNGNFSQGLGNLTSGIESLQKTEISKRLQEIEQNKANARTDALRNEEFALKMASTDVINDKRIAIAEQAAKDAESFIQANTDMVKRAQSEGRGLTLAEKMKLVTDQKKILSNNAQAANFADALEKAQSIHISTLKSLKDPESKAQYDKQWADLYRRIKDPVLSKDLSPSDIMAAIEPPPPPSSVVFAETAKSLLPFVDSSIKSVGGGRTAVDKDKLITAIKTNVPADDYLYTKGVEEKRWSNPDEMYNQLAERIAPSIKTDVVGWKPDKTPESEKVSGFEGRMTSSVNPSETVDAYVFDKTKPFEGSYTPTGSTKPTSAKITPLGIRSDGMLEAEITINKKVTSAPMTYSEAQLQAAQVKGTVVKSDDGSFRVISTQPEKETNIIPLSGDIAEKIRRADPNAASYIDKLNPYPKRTGAKSNTSQPTEIKGKTKDGKIAVFDATTKKFLRYAK